jgi:hypothetical protein
MGIANKGYSLGPGYKKLQRLRSRFARIYRTHPNKAGSAIKMSDRQYIVGRGGEFRRVY